jgi:glycosyltransferase involved in cell wall biosynthesis
MAWWMVVKVSVVAFEHPLAEGTAAGRALWTWCNGVVSLGNELEVWSWYPSPPRQPLPEWCQWRPLPDRSLWRAHLQGLLRPRHDSALAGWEPDSGAVAVADDVPSFAAVAPFDRSVVTIHFRALADARAVRALRAPQVQLARAERHGGRRAGLAMAFSPRVGRHLRRPAVFVPIAYPVPAEALPVVDEPVAALLADWSWPPNHRALEWLLAAWPEVRDAVPAARLLLAGRHLERASVGSMAGVETLGAVASSTDVLARAAVIAFPCPPTSGPKVKVLEALAHGVPVVTTQAGVEGLVVEPGDAVAVDRRHFASGLASLLTEPERRAQMAAGGRRSALAHHDGIPVARARLKAFEDAFFASPVVPL